MATPVPTQESTPQTTSSWRGSAKQAEYLPTHDWQTDTPTPRRVRSVPKFLAVVGLLISLGLLAMFVVTALDAPAKTPIVFIDAFASGAVANRWGEEDFQRFAALDGQTASVVKLTVNDRASAGGLVGLADAIRQQKHQIAAAQCLVIFLNAPKGVNDAEEPAFLLPNSDPLDSTTWVSLPEVLDQISASLHDELPDEVETISTLLAIDGPDSQSNLAAGMPRNQFCQWANEWLTAEHRQDRNRQFSVLLGASADQVATVSDARGARAFAFAVAAGLSGRADKNNDGAVTFGELDAWVANEVDHWAGQRYHRRQVPQLVQAETSNVRLIQSLASSSQASWKRTTENLTTPANTVSLQDVDALWSRWDELRERHLWTHLPAGWHELTSQLIRLEFLLQGGANAGKSATQLHEVLALRLQQLATKPVFTTDFAAGDFELLNASIANRLGLWQESQVQSVEPFRRSLQNATSLKDLQAALEQLQESLPNTKFDLRRSIELVVDEAPQASRERGDLLGMYARLSNRVSLSQGPQDARHYRLFVPALADAESLRRDLLDALLIGTPETLRDAESLHPQINETLAELDRQVRIQHELLGRRDRLWAEIPAFMQLQDALAGRDAQSLAASLADAVKTLHVIDRTLQDNESIALGEFVAWHSELVACQVELQAILDQVYDRFLTAEVLAPADRGLAETLLSTGLLSSHQDSLNRSPLQQRRTLRDRLIAMDEVGPEEDATRKAMPPWLREPVAENDLSLAWLFDVITADEVRNADSSRLPTPPEFRHRLARDRERLSRLARIVRQRLSDVERHTKAEFRDAAVKYRRLATWLPSDDGDWIARIIHRRAWANRCFEQAETTLDDFLAAHRPELPPWFETTSEALLSVGRSLLHPTLSDGGEIAQIENLKTRRVSVLQTGLPIRGVPIPTALLQDPLKTELTLTISPELRDQLPSGQVALGVGLTGEHRHVTGNSVPIRRGTIEPTTVQWENSPSVDVARWHATADFRGHHFSDPLGLKPVGGLCVVTHQSPLGPANVVVEGGDLEDQAIMFVLDCSASMTEAISREGQTGEVRKLDAARQALLNLLDSLQERHKLHLGVMLYGHRVAAGFNSAAGRQWQRRYVSQFPCSKQLQPFEDVETILPPGRFRSLERDLVAQRLRLLLPWGETPLHLSLAESVRQLSRLEGMRHRTIVVITDGRNYQFNPTADKRRTVEQVIAAANQSGVAIHLVGVGMPSDQRARARTEFEQIAKATAGSCDVDVDDADRLRTKLRGLFELSRFSLTNADGRQFENLVGRPISIPTPQQIPETWTLRCKDQSIGLMIRGNEELSFAKSDDLESLRVTRKTPTPIRVSPIVDLHEQPTGLQCGWLTPRLDNEQLTLTACISRDDQTYLDWDGRFLVLATPLTRDGDSIGNPIVLWESFRKPKTANPTYSWTIANWPTDAKTVRLVCWFPKGQIPVQQFDVGKMLEMVKRGDSIGPDDSNNQQWQIRVDGEMLTLIERFGQTRGTAERFLLQLNLPGTIAEATHRRDDQNQIAVHTWKTTNKNISEFLIERIDVFQLKKHAMRAANSLELPTEARKPIVPLTQLPRQAIAH